MPKQSILYPNRPWPVAELEKHPRTQALQMLKAEHKDAPLKYAMMELIEKLRTGEFQNGCTLNKLLSSMPTRSFEVMQELAEELVRMRVFVIDYTDTEARLIPATQVAAAESERVKSRSVSINMPLALLDRLKVAADRRHQSVSGLAVSAIEEFLGEAAA